MAGAGEKSAKSSVRATKKVRKVITWSGCLTRGSAANRVVTVGTSNLCKFVTSKKEGL